MRRRSLGKMVQAGDGRGSEEWSAAERRKWGRKERHESQAGRVTEGRGTCFVLESASETGHGSREEKICGSSGGGGGGGREADRMSGSNNDNGGWQQCLKVTGPVMRAERGGAKRAAAAIAL